jgi:hypothetical protein
VIGQYCQEKKRDALFVQQFNPSPKNVGVLKTFILYAVHTSYLTVAFNIPL